MAKKSQTISGIFILIGFILSSVFLSSIIGFIPLVCREGICFTNDPPLFDTIIVLLTILFLVFDYFYEHEKLVNRRNIIAIVGIYLVGFLLTFTITALYAIGTMMLLSSFDGGKKAALMGNKRKIYEATAQLHESKPNLSDGRKVGGNVVRLMDGLIGFGILSFLSISLSVSVDLVTLEQIRAVLPIILFLGFSIDLQYFVVMISILLSVGRAGFFLVNKIIKSNSIQKSSLKVLGTRFNFLIYILLVVIILFLFSALMLTFAKYSYYPELQPLIQSLMLLVWGSGYLLNSY